MTDHKMRDTVWKINSLLNTEGYDKKTKKMILYDAIRLAEME